MENCKKVYAVMDNEGGYLDLTYMRCSDKHLCPQCRRKAIDEYHKEEAAVGLLWE